MSVPVIVAVMLAGYLLVMGLLGLGLRRAAAERRHPPAPGRGGRRGWPGLARQVAGTAVGGYVLLMSVVTAYYYGVARLGGGFLLDAFTGSALLLAICLPVFAAASWLADRRDRRRGGGSRGGSGGGGA